MNHHGKTNKSRKVQRRFKDEDSRSIDPTCRYPLHKMSTDHLRLRLSNSNDILMTFCKYNLQGSQNKGELKLLKGEC